MQVRRTTNQIFNSSRTEKRTKKTNKKKVQKGSENKVPYIPRKRKDIDIYIESHLPMKSELEPKEVGQILNIKKDLFTCSSKLRGIRSVLQTSFLKLLPSLVCPQSLVQRM